MSPQFTNNAFLPEAITQFSNYFFVNTQRKLGFDATRLEVQFAQRTASSTKILGAFFNRDAIKHDSKMKQIGIQITPTALIRHCDCTNPTTTTYCKIINAMNRKI